MIDKELDELFRKSFSGHEAPVPEEMWQRVNPHKEKKRRVAFWWWSGLGVAALLIAGAFAWWHGASSTPAKEVAVPNASPISHTSPSTISASDAGKAAITQTTPSPQNPKTANDKMLLAPDEKSFGAEQKQHANNRYAVHHKDERFVYHTNGRINNTSIKTETNQQEEKVNVPNTISNEAANTGKLQAESSAPSAINHSSADSAAVQSGITAKADSAAASNATAAVQVHLPKSRKMNLEWSMAGFVGDRNVYSVKKEMPAFAITLNEPHEETTVRGYSLNMRIEKPFAEHWSLKTGLQFLQVRQSVTYNAESVSRYSVVNALSLGADTTQFTQISLHRPDTRSIYNSFSLPLLLSYHADIKKLSIGATGGIMLNLFSWYKGEVPDGNYMSQLAANETFRKNHGSSLYIGLPVARSFGKWQLFIEPQLQYSLSSLTQSKTAFKQKMTYYGLGIGIRKPLHQ